MEQQELKHIIEALLFVAEKPVTLEQFRAVIKGQTKGIADALNALREELETDGRGFRMREIAGGYCFVSDPGMADYVKAFAATKDKRKLSGASLETLSIIAYRQPITRQEIEFIRGVNVDGAVQTLVEKGLIKITGRKDAPGRPILYGTTRSFLDHFGLGGLKDLPKLAEFTEKDIELPESLRQAGAALPEEFGEEESDVSAESAGEVLNAQDGREDDRAATAVQDEGIRNES